MASRQPTAAIYARKSTDTEDRQVQSLPDQLRWAGERAAHEGLSTPQLFQEAMSAKKVGRPEFGRLLAAIDAGRVDTIICWKADRLARNALDGGKILHALETGVLQRIITADRVYDGSGDSNLILTIEFGMATKFSRDLGRNVERAVESKLSRGEWIARAPLGYRNVQGQRERQQVGSVAIDPSVAPYMTRLFELAASGNHSLRDLTMLAVQEWRLPFQGLSRRTDGKEHLPINTIAKILHNPFYYGVMRVKGRLYPGSHQPLIKKDLFDRVQDVLAGRDQRAAKPEKHFFPYSGLVLCADCERLCSGYAHQKAGRRYAYYRCTNRSRGQCDNAAVNEKNVDAVVMDTLRRISLTEEECSLALEVLAALQGKDDGLRRGARERVATTIAGLKQKQSALLDLLLERRITQDDYEFKRRDIAAQVAELQLQGKRPMKAVLAASGESG